jgi:hypothetical protein
MILLLFGKLFIEQAKIMLFYLEFFQPEFFDQHVGTQHPNAG